MKKNIFILFSLALLAVSCQKDVLVSNGTKLNDFSMTTNDIRVEKDVMIFKDQTTFNKVIESLRELSKNEEYLRTNWKAISKSAEVDSRSQPEIPYYAVFDIFANNRNKFKSLLKAQREEEDAFLLQGGNPIDFHRSFIEDDYLQALMNPKHEIQIGKLIYKYVDNNNAYVITNGDINLIDKVRNHPNPYAFPKTANIKFLNINIAGDVKYYSQLVAGTLSCAPSFEIIPLGSNNIALHNTSMTMGGITSFGWKLTDANGTVFFNQTDPNEFSLDNMFVYQSNYPNNPLPWDIQLTIASTSCATMTTNNVWQGLAAECLPIDFSVHRVSDIPTRYREFIFRPFIASTGGNITQGAATVWNFGDGTSNVLSGEIDGSIQHEFPSNTNATDFIVTCTVTFSGTCSKVITKTITVNGCGSHQSDKDAEVKYASNSRKLFGNIWMDNTWFYSSVGGKAYNYRSVWYGWARENADAISMEWSNTSKFIKNCQDEINLGVTLSANNKDEIRDDRFQFGSNTDVSARIGNASCIFRATDNRGSVTLTLNW